MDFFISIVYYYCLLLFFCYIYLLVSLKNNCESSLSPGKLNRILIYNLDYHHSSKCLSSLRLPFSESFYCLKIIHCLFLDAWASIFKVQDNSLTLSHRQKKAKQSSILFNDNFSASFVCCCISFSFGDIFWYFNLDQKANHQWLDNIFFKQKNKI